MFLGSKRYNYIIPLSLYLALSDNTYYPVDLQNVCRLSMTFHLQSRSNKTKNCTGYYIVTIDKWAKWYTISTRSIEIDNPLRGGKYWKISQGLYLLPVLLPIELRLVTNPNPLGKNVLLPVSSKI